MQLMRSISRNVSRNALAQTVRWFAAPATRLTSAADSKANFSRCVSVTRCLTHVGFLQTGTAKPQQLCTSSIPSTLLETSLFNWQQRTRHYQTMLQSGSVSEGRRGLAKKSRHATQKAHLSPSSTEEALEHGVEKVIFTHPAPNQFRLLTGLCGFQLGFWVW